MSNELPIRLRPATQEDVPFIFNSWLRSYKYSRWTKNITSQIYYSEHHKLIEKLLKNFSTIIACNDNDPSQIYGFISAGYVEGIFCMHYIYVKRTFRNLGIARTLLNSFEHDATTAGVFTHDTRASEKLAAKYNMVYHPYLLFNLPSKESDESKE